MTKKIKIKKISVLQNVFWKKCFYLKGRRKEFVGNQNIHCTENHTFFFQTSWKDGLSKKVALEYDYSCIIEKDDISFSQKIWSYTLDGKWRMIFLKKHTEIWCFLQTFWKDGLSKKSRAGTWSFLYYLERWYFFPKTWSFFPGQKVKHGLPQEIQGNMMHRPAKKNRKPDI